MFGYVKAYKPQMRVCEFELYKGVYCGLCKKLTERFGFAASLPLSYDFVFLTLMQVGLNGTKLKADRKICPAHPVKKTICVRCEGAERELEYSADAQIILTYHKLCDDLHDKGIKSKLFAAVTIPFFANHYKQAAKKRPTLAAAVETAMKNQRQTERLKYRSLDRAAEPTAAIMRAIFRETGGCDPDKRDTLGQFGYMLGRYVYICDALDDLCEDFQKRNYNPFLSKKTIFELTDEKKLPLKYREKAADAAEQSVCLTLANLANIYASLSLGEIKPLTDNIIYLGLKNNFTKIKEKTLGDL